MELEEKEEEGGLKQSGILVWPLSTYHNFSMSMLSRSPHFSGPPRRPPWAAVLAKYETVALLQQPLRPGPGYPIQFTHFSPPNRFEKGGSANPRTGFVGMAWDEHTRSRLCK